MATNEIIIAGQPFALSEDITVITWDQPGALSFPAKRAEAMAATGSPLYSDRVVPGKGKIKDYDRLTEFVSQIVLHTDLTSDAKKCFGALLGRGLSTHFMIDWDGVIFQGVDVLYVAYHAGEANNGAIGIDLNNKMANLVREPNADMYNPDHERFAEMSQKKYRRRKSGVMRINGSKVRAYGYTDAQYLSLIELLKVLTSRFTQMEEGNCPFDAKGDIVPDVLEDPAFKGFIGHWHISPSRWDPGPGFDWQRVFFALKAEHNSFPIEIEPGKNIATLLEPGLVREYAEAYFANTELQGAGGWYPIGINQTWHGGVHVAAKRGTPVRAMFDGVLVAARFGQKPGPLGHNNFVLIKHTVPIPVKKGAEPKSFVFYSLYMHLDAMGVAKEDLDDDSPKWLKEMYRIDKGKTDDEESALEGGKTEESKEDKPDEGEEVPLDDEEDEDQGGGPSDTPSKAAFMKLGQHITALKKGQISLVAYADDPIKVLSGQVVGNMGMFGESGNWRPMVHVEVFADPKKDWKEAVNLGIHGRYLVALDDDVGQDLFIENQDILSIFSRSTAPKGSSLIPQKVVDRSDIDTVFTTPDEFVEEKRYLRKVVTRHVSEWSDQVDWVRALSPEGEDWASMTQDFRRILRGSPLGRDAIATVLPYIWLSKDVAQHIGLDVEGWRGVLDHFHPIQFLLWLTYNSSQRIHETATGMSKAKRKKLKKQEIEREEACRTGALGAADCEGVRVGYGATYDDIDEDEGDIGEVLRSWLDDWDMGEWKRTPPLPDE